MPISAAEDWTLACAQMDFADWRKGRREYALWAIDLDFPEVHRACSDAASRIAACLLANYRRQPHLTLQVCGFPSRRAQHTDDYALSTLLGQVARLQAMELAPFEITVGGLGTFSSAAYLKVDDPSDSIDRLRLTLGNLETGDAPSPYVPHVTFGLYGKSIALPAILEQLGGPAPRLCRQVDSISLMTYEAAVIGGTLSEIGRFHFEKRLFTPVDRKVLHERFATNQLGA